MSGRDDLPEHVAAASEEAQAAWIAAYDAVIYQDLEALIDDVKRLNPAIKQFDCSCFDGVYVTGDVGGAEESPVYAIFKLNEKIEQLNVAAPFTGASGGAGVKPAATNFGLAPQCGVEFLPVVDVVEVDGVFD